MGIGRAVVTLFLEQRAKVACFDISTAEARRKCLRTPREVRRLFRNRRQRCRRQGAPTLRFVGYSRQLRRSDRHFRYVNNVLLPVYYTDCTKHTLATSQPRPGTAALLSTSTANEAHPPLPPRAPQTGPERRHR